MRIAIVHYHLQPGGVTRVIENAVTSMEGKGVTTVVVAAEPYAGAYPIHSVSVPGLGYTQPNEKPDPGALCFTLKTAARKALGGDPDLWHIHNHALGKNNAMPQVVDKLAQEAAVLLQIHDFAEDGRPAQYRLIERHLPAPEILYPVAPHVHYAVLNGRDLRFLKCAGIPEHSLHLLPNPVAPPAADGDGPTENPPGLPPDAHLMLYPTRAIRRKNIGEMLLWALAAENGRVFASTLVPADAEALRQHEKWRAVARELKLPVRFGLGAECGWTFPQLMQAADTLITTSIAEGFGLAFIEPWLFNKGLAGRDIPDVTCDFRNIGIELKHLYPRLDIPLEAVGAAALRQALTTAVPEYFQAYGCTPPAHAVEQAWQAIVREPYVDFGGLNEDLQATALRYLAANASTLKAIRPPAPEKPSAERIARNHACITENFSLARYGDSLALLYRNILEQAVSKTEYLPPRALLEPFLKPERFRLLRT